MIQKEINEFLANTKVYVNGKSKEIQKKLFSLGYKWCNGVEEVCDTESPFLFIYSNMSFTRSNDMESFSNHENREITAEEILSIKLTEPDYRPFKDIEECWAEMLKHQPFGWLKHKEMPIYENYGSNKNYNLITKVSNSTAIGKAADFVVELQNDKFCYYDMVNLHDNYTFVDGTPFGIKEE